MREHILKLQDGSQSSAAIEEDSFTTGQHSLQMTKLQNVKTDETCKFRNLDFSSETHDWVKTTSYTIQQEQALYGIAEQLTQTEEPAVVQLV